MSRIWRAERGLRCLFKVLEFIVSIYFVYVMYFLGPHWIMLVAALLVPIYGLYLVVARSVDPSTNQGLHSMPYLRYKTLIKAKVWQRADIAISLSMSVVCCGFSAILFFGYFKVRSATPYFLHAAISALLLAFLYTFDALITVCQLKSGSVDFAKSDKFTKSFPNDSKHNVQADFTNSFATPSNNFKSAFQHTNQEQQKPIQLPNSSSAAVPTILDRLRLEIESEHRYAHPQHTHHMEKIEMPRKSWFDEERHGELTNSTSLSNTSAQQQQIDRHYWEESRQINDVIVAPTRQTTYSRFQQIDEPMELQPNANHFMNSSNSSAKTQIQNKRLNLSNHLSGSADELPPPPNTVQPAQRSTKSRPVVIPANQYKISSQPYTRKIVYPAVDQQIYTQIPQNRSSSNRNSETTGTSDEDLNMKTRMSQPSTSHSSTVLNYPLDVEELRNQPRPAPLIFYKTSQAHVHPPVKARMVLIEDDVELTNRRPIMENSSRGSSKSSATARMDDFVDHDPSSTTLVNMNASH